MKQTTTRSNATILSLRTLFVSLQFSFSVSRRPFCLLGDQTHNFIVQRLSTSIAFASLPPTNHLQLFPSLKCVQPHPLSLVSFHSVLLTYYQKLIYQIMKGQHMLPCMRALFYPKILYETIQWVYRISCLRLLSVSFSPSRPRQPPCAQSLQVKADFLAYQRHFKIRIIQLLDAVRS
jgi:hypothetical protein